MGIRILVVDDSKLARMAINKTLRSLHPDWISIEAASAEEALRSLEKTPPDIALLDYQMPERDGLDLAEALHRLKPSMPMAVVSANQQSALIDRARALGASFLPKPLSEQALREFLEGAVQRLGQPASQAGGKRES
jgi:CheY-like chemotaxis protein